MAPMREAAARRQAYARTGHLRRDGRV